MSDTDKNQERLNELLRRRKELEDQLASARAKMPVFGGREAFKCGNCNESISSTDKFCVYCGTSTSEGRYEPTRFDVYDSLRHIYGPRPIMRNHICHSCGNQWRRSLMDDREQFCPKCGSKVEVVEEEDRW